MTPIIASIVNEIVSRITQYILFTDIPPYKSQKYIIKYSNKGYTIEKHYEYSHTDIDREIAPIIVIGGTTASGKSDIAIEVAKQLKCKLPYIINADSRQVYDRLFIGGAQPVFDKIINPEKVCVHCERSSDYKRIIDKTSTEKSTIGCTEESNSPMSSNQNISEEPANCILGGSMYLSCDNSSIDAYSENDNNFSNDTVSVNEKSFSDDISINNSSENMISEKFNLQISDGIKHYLYGYNRIDKEYNLFDYKKDCDEILQNITGTPLLVGGTGMYIESVIYNYQFNENFNQSIIDENHIVHLREKLNKLNIIELQKIAGDSINNLNNSDRNNPRRLIRIIEKQNIYGKDKVFETYNKKLNRRHIYFTLIPEKEVALERIVNRCIKMKNNGLIQENISILRDLHNSKKDPQAIKSLNAIGYKEFFTNKMFINLLIANNYVLDEKEIDSKIINEILNQININTVKLYKKQKTWFCGNHIK